MKTASATKPRKRSPIGLDIGRSAIKAVQLRRLGGQWSLLASAMLPRAGGEETPTSAELQRVVAVLERSGFQGNAAVLAVPPSQLLSAMLDLPPRAPNVPLDQIARVELARVHKREPAGIELSYWDLPAAARASKGTTVMAVACPHSAADAYLDAIEAAGFDVLALDTAASAMVRACLPLCKPSETTAILDMGYSDARLALVQQGQITYERTMAEAGLQPLCQSLQRKLDLGEEEVRSLLTTAGLEDPADRRTVESLAPLRRYLLSHLSPLLSELHVTFAYNEQRYPTAPVQQLLLCGGGAAIPRLDLHMAGDLGVAVRAVGVSDVLMSAALPDVGCASAMMIATGLAQFEDC